MGSVTISPFAPPPPRRHLDHAPLDLVVGQIRFPAILGIDVGGEIVAAFQERIREKYPVLEIATEIPLAIIGIGGAPSFPPEPVQARVWRFQSRDGWQIALARTFVALSTTRYTHRADFISRLGFALDALATTVKPGLCERIGVRYASRITAPGDMDRLTELLRPEVLGPLAAALPGDVQPVHAITDTLYQLPEATLHARWGRLPQNAVLDITVPAVSTPSFLIDIDVFAETPRDFAPTQIIEQVRSFCDRQYAFFRWAVTEAYLQTYDVGEE